MLYLCGMKNLKNICLGLALIFLGAACSNDFELVEEWKDIPVVYGFLSKQDTINHFIRIEKAFLDPETSAFVIAQNVDSLYYDNIAVQLERVSTGDIFNLERVDGRDFGINREEGIFANEPNYLYRFDLGGQELEGGEDYKLTINRGDNLPLVTATTKVVSDFGFLRPTVPGALNWANYISPQRLSWRVEDDAFIFDVRIAIHFKETDPANPGNLIDRTLMWDVQKNIKANGEPQLRLEINGFDFFNFIKNNVEENPNIDRFFESYDFLIDAGGLEILEFANLNSANTGITSSQIIPVYTNLSEGRGVFTSRNTSKIEGFTLQSESLDTLREGSLTGNLNFK